MKKQKIEQNGFAMVLVLVVVILVVIGFIGYRVMGSKPKKDEPTNQKADSQMQAKPNKDEPLVLQNLGINLSSVLISQDAVREYQSKGLKGFYVFGDKLGGKDDIRKNPNFEFSSLKPDTKVVSAIDGVVGFIKEQSESNDMEVFIQPSEGSVWTIGYDHLTNVTIKRGDKVKAGDVLGTPAVQNNGLHRFEIQINKDLDGKTTHYCPSTLLASSVKDSLLKELGDMQTSWESKTGLDLYDLSKQDPIGCLEKTMLPTE